MNKILGNPFARAFNPTEAGQAVSTKLNALKISSDMVNFQYGIHDGKWVKVGERPSEFLGWCFGRLIQAVTRSPEEKAANVAARQKFVELLKTEFEKTPFFAKEKDSNRLLDNFLKEVGFDHNSTKPLSAYRMHQVKTALFSRFHMRDLIKSINAGFDNTSATTIKSQLPLETEKITLNELNNIKNVLTESISSTDLNKVVDRAIKMTRSTLQKDIDPIELENVSYDDVMGTADLNRNIKDLIRQPNYLISNLNIICGFFPQCKLEDDQSKNTKIRIANHARDHIRQIFTAQRHALLTIEALIELKTNTI